jgi:hypothetical protein
MQEETNNKDTVIDISNDTIHIEITPVNDIINLDINKQPIVFNPDIDLIHKEYYCQSNSPLTISENSDSENDNENKYNNTFIEKNGTINHIGMDKFLENIEQYSANGTNSGSEDEILGVIRKERIHHQVHHNKNSFKFKAYNDIEKTLGKYYDNDNKYSSKMDILITFMKGQKNIYMQSKYITQRKLNGLMIPILILSAGMAVFSPFIQHYNWSGGFISGLNIIITTFVSLMNYMKFETHVEMYLQLANHYDKMEISLEMSNSQLLFIENENEKNELILSKLKEVELKINELKEIYNILIPSEVRHIFPIICNLNILSLITKMENYKKTLIHKFKDVKNEIRYILYKWKKENTPSFENSEKNIDHENIKTKEKNRLVFLYQIKENIKNELLESKKIYDYVEDIFIREIKNAEYNNQLWFWCFWNIKTIHNDTIPAILNKHFHFIFEDM